MKIQIIMFHLWVKVRKKIKQCVDSPEKLYFEKAPWEHYIFK
jgi:hypothetical protein